MDANNNLISPESEPLTVNKSESNYVSMRISFEMDLQLSGNVTSEITSVINSYLSNITSTLEVVGFQPSSKCYTCFIYQCI